MNKFIYMLVVFFVYCTLVTKADPLAAVGDCIDKTCKDCFENNYTFCLNSNDNTSLCCKDPSNICTKILSPANCTKEPNSTTTSTTTPSTTSSSTSTPTESTPKVTSVVPSSTAPPKPTSPSRRHFDAPSFIGGIVLSLGLLAIVYVSFKFYKARTERNYHTL
ncbi:hypothetical protein JTE90_010824 [Oedothorax gibbosus]|uniref:Sialomucin core protein 24 n=1 Tax=Oedothorax gibbosus TaxID=931172 RepID=A0AAV6V5M7_9ARAC|nr:hypothetical protein JTE90_010824 [Oedothorax gibbosus]